MDGIGNSFKLDDVKGITDNCKRQLIEMQNKKYAKQEVCKTFIIALVSLYSGLPS